MHNKLIRYHCGISGTLQWRGGYYTSTQSCETVGETKEIVSGLRRVTWATGCRPRHHVSQGVVVKGGVAVGENAMNWQRGAACGAALKDGEEELLVVASDADEARETSLDHLHANTKSGWKRCDESDKGKEG